MGTGLGDLTCENREIGGVEELVGGTDAARATNGEVYEDRQN